MGLGFPEVIVLVIVFLLIFGPKRIPEISKALGKSIHDFKKGMSGDDSEKKNLPNDEKTP